MITLKIDQAQELTTTHLEVTLEVLEVGMHHNMVVLIFNLKVTGVVDKD